MRSGEAGSRQTRGETAGEDNAPSFDPHADRRAPEPPPASGLHAQEIKASGLHAQENKASGLHAQENKASGLHAQESKASGLHAQESKASGLHAQENKASGLHAQGRNPSGLHAQEIKASGLHAQEIKAPGLHAQGTEARAPAEPLTPGGPALDPGVCRDPDDRRAGAAPDDKARSDPPAPADFGRAEWEGAALRLALETATTPIYVCDRDYIIRFANDAYAGIESRDASDIIGRPVAETIGHDLFRLRKPNIDRALAGDAVSFRAWIWSRTERRGDQYEVSYHPVRDAAGRVTAVLARAEPIRPSEAPQASEQAYRKIFRLSQDGLLRLTPVRRPDGRPINYLIMEANPAIARAAARELRELEGALLFDVLARLLPGDLPARFAEVLATGAPQQFEYHHHLDAERGWWRISMFRSAEEELTVLFSNISATVDRRRELQVLTHRLGEDKRRLERLYRTAPALLVSLSDAGVVEEASEAFLDRLDRPRDEVIGRSFGELVAPEALDSLNEEIWPRLFRTRSVANEPCRLCVGPELSVVDVELSAQLLEDDSGMRKVTMMLTDVTRRNRALYESRRAERDYRLLVDRLPDLISRAHPDTTLFFANRHYIDFFGPDEEALMGRRFMELVPAKFREPLMAQLAAMTREHPVSMQEQVNHDHAGRARNILWISMLIHDLSGRPREILSIGRDVTPLREANNRLLDHASRLEAANESLKQFAFVASHDLQEPLRKIRLYADVMQTALGAEDEAELQSALEVIVRAARNGSRLISDLLSYTQATNRPLERTQLRVETVVAQVLDDLKEEIQAAGTAVEVETDPVPISADPVSLREIVYNLITNALKYRAADRTPHLRVRFQACADDEAHCLTVEDNGIGFDPEGAETMFQPFKRLHGRAVADGSGIGLAICEAAANRHGWTVTARGWPGTGARFEIRMPR
ncbi:PAS domain-containing protein [Stappia sp.]|uniref:PAS domain-containing sensor histidine kinase n=1 Tax=Stappia sp. TaxID=1870903 RepID=UPI0032D9A719